MLRDKINVSRKRLSLRFILVLYVLVPLGIALGVTGFTALKIWEQQVESRMQNDLEMVARAIQLPLSHAVEKKREGGMDQALESAISLDNVYSAYAYDLEGAEIASAGDQAAEGAEQDKLTKLASEGEKTGEYGEMGERRVYSYFVPLLDSRKQPSGILQLTRREEEFREYIGKVRQNALIGSILGLIAISALVLVAHHHALGRHFQRLIQGMQRVAHGETEHRLPLSGPTEIASISSSFNEMLDSIQKAQSELQQKREEQLTLERQLRQSEKLAAIGQLAAGVAHELGTPLSTISGAAQRAARKENADSLRTKTFDRIQNEVKRMETIIRRLLDFSHSRGLQPRKLRPSQVAKSAMTAVQEEAAAAGAELSVSGEADAPLFSADPIRLEQALVNLLRNAIQAGQNMAVRIAWRREEGQMVFSVDDNGPGIDESIREQLFEPFFTTKNVGAGTGLGLAVVHGIISEHGGGIHVTDSEWGGARFELYLPISENGDENT